MRLAVAETATHGGLLHYAVQLGDALAARGHDVELLTTRGNELSAHRGAALMRPILTPPVRSADAAPTGVAYRARQAAIAARLTGAWAQLAVLARRSRYDALVLDSDLTLALSAAAALGLTALPGRPALVHVCHNARPYNRWGGDELFGTSPALHALLRRLYPRFDLVLVHGARSRADFEATWPPSRLAEIPHGDERIFGGEPPAPSEEERILFFGDWRKVKGLPLLMEAFDRLAERRPRARLTIAGTPAPADLEPGIVHAWAARHGDRVAVVDRYVPMEDVPAVFGAARVVATPYLVGFQSGVVHLAMTMGRAVVTTDVGDLPAAVRHGETGLVVPPQDPAALADALERVLADPQLAARLGAAGRARVLEGSGWETVAERVEAELQGIRRIAAS